MNTLFTFFAGICAAVLILFGSRYLKMGRKPEWLARLHGDVPWATPRSIATVASGHEGIGNNIFVSRHDIAESGLQCPLCRKEAVERGDFSKVYKMLVDGHENEVVQCPNRRTIQNDQEVDCKAWLIASPTTEHGDHLDDEGNVSSDGAMDKPEFFRFKRISAAQALREQWGVDIEAAPEGEIAVVEPEMPLEERLKSKRHEVLAGEELRLAIARDFAAQAAACATTPPTGAPIRGDDTTVKVQAIPDPEKSV
jgi:hypothetical protein